MFLSSPRSNRQTLAFRPNLESLDNRIVPANAHFVSGGTESSVDPTNGALTVDFHEAGLGKNEEVDIVLSADAEATYQWFNKGGNRPMGVPFNVNGTFSVGDTFTSGDNGQISDSLTLYPPSVDEFLSTNHAANWIPVLSVSYTNVVVTDTTNGVSTADAGINLDQPETVIFTV